MPNLNHCIECDKPTANSITKLCDNCNDKIKIEDVEPTTADKYNKEWLDEKGSES